MDFSSNTNSLLDPLLSQSNLKILSPRASTKPSNRTKSVNSTSNRNSPTRPIKDGCAGLEIFQTDRLKQEKIVIGIQSPQYNHIYKEEIFIDDIISHFKAQRKPENPNADTTKFVETGKFFKIKRADFKASKIDNGRSDRKWIGERKGRCQTALISCEKWDSPRHSPRFRDQKGFKRELCPLTKARSPSRYKLRLESLSVIGTNKDFTIRRNSNIYGSSKKSRDC